MPNAETGISMLRQVVFAVAILNLLALTMVFMVPVYLFFFGSIFVAAALLVALSYYVMQEDEAVRVQNEINERLRLNTEKLEERVKELEKKLGGSA
jgi:hypothetical protein